MKELQWRWPCCGGMKLACPLQSRLARRRRICLLGRIKGLGNFPGDRKGPIDCFPREHAVIQLIKSSRGGFYTNENSKIYGKEVDEIYKRNFVIADTFIRGTQRGYSSKPLNRSIVERILAFKRQIQAYFYPLKHFHLFGFPSQNSSEPKIVGIKTYLFESFIPEKAPENSRWPFLG